MSSIKNDARKSKGERSQTVDSDSRLNSHPERTFESNASVPRLRVVNPRDRQEYQKRVWHDMKLFSSSKYRPNRRNAVTLASNDVDYADSSVREGPTSTAARRLSLVVDDGVFRSGSNPSPRRASLTPLAYFDQSDALEQFIESEQVTNSDSMDGLEPIAMADLYRSVSAEHFHVPRNSIAAGIKIEITPPSAFKEQNEFLVDTVVVEVPDNGEADDLNVHSRVFLVQQLGSSTTDLPDLAEAISATSALAHAAGSNEEVTSTQEPPRERRRTKLLAIQVRRQTLSAVQKPPKTVRFASSPTRDTLIRIEPDDDDDVVDVDETSFIWTKAVADELETPDQIETESEEPWNNGLLRSYEFSEKELSQAGLDVAKFVGERLCIRNFFANRLSKNQDDLNIAVEA